MKYKGFLCGLVIGSLSMAVTGVMADNKSVTATVSNPIFKFNGNYKIPSGSDYSGIFALSYNGRLYVPPKFVAEGLGADTEWDIHNNTVSITAKESEKLKEPETEKNTEKPEETEKETKDISNYHSIPVGVSYAEMDMTVTIIERNKDNTKVVVRVKNTCNIPLSLKQEKTVLGAGGKSYYASDIPSYDWNKTWFNDIRDTTDTYILLPAIPEDTEIITLQITVVVNDGTQKEITVPFNIKLN